MRKKTKPTFSTFKPVSLPYLIDLKCFWRREIICETLQHAVRESSVQTSNIRNVYFRT